MIECKAETPICIVRGDDKKFRLHFTTDGVTPVNLTGAKVYLTVKKRIEDADSDAVIQKIVTTHTDPVNGITEIKLSHTETKIDLGRYFYDVQLTDAGNEVKTVLIGYFTVTKEVTKEV